MGLLHRQDQSAWWFCRLAGRVYRAVLLCGMVRGTAVGIALCGAATVNGQIITEGLVSAESGASGGAVVADGRY